MTPQTNSTTPATTPADAPPTPAAGPGGWVYRSAAPFEAERVHAAAIYCSDGRFGLQMDDFLYNGLALPRYDRLAVPGGAACLAGHTNTAREKAALERQLDFLIREHGLERVVLIAHEGCAFYKDLWTGHCTVRQQQALDVDRAIEQIRLWNRHVEVEAYFAVKDDGFVAFERWVP